MRASLALVLLLASGCDESPGVDQDRVNTQMIANVAFVGNEMSDPGASARLQPLTGVVAAEPGPDCRFTRGADVLVHASGAGATVRIDGAVRVFRVEGTVTRDGGFFRDRELALSIGTVSGRPARARVTNRTTRVREDHEGQWQCAQVTG